MLHQHLPKLFIGALLICTAAATYTTDAPNVYDQDMCVLVRYIAKSSSGSNRWYGVNDNACGYWNGDTSSGAPGRSSVYQMPFDSSSSDLRSAFASDSAAANGNQKTIKYDTLQILGRPWTRLVFSTGDNSASVIVRRSDWCQSGNMFINSDTTTIHSVSGDGNSPITWTASGSSNVNDVELTSGRVAINRTWAPTDPWVSAGRHMLLYPTRIQRVLYGEDGWNDNSYSPDGLIDRLNDKDGVKVYACNVGTTEQCGLIDNGLSFLSRNCPLCEVCSYDPDDACYGYNGGCQ